MNLVITIKIISIIYWIFALKCNLFYRIYFYLFYRKAHLSSKKLLEQCQKLEKLWTHVYTGTLNLTSITAESQWYTKLTDLIDNSRQLQFGCQNLR